MGVKLITQQYRKDPARYDYAYFSVRETKSGFLRILPVGIRYALEVIDEDSGDTLFTSGEIGGLYDYSFKVAYNNAMNFMLQNHWEEDGTVIDWLRSEGSLPRFRRPLSAIDRGR